MSLSAQGIKRLQQEMEEIQIALKYKQESQLNPNIQNVCFGKRGNGATDMSRWFVYFKGSENMKGMNLCYELDFKPNFPFEGPQGKMLGGLIHYHVHQHGKICHPLLNKWCPQTSLLQLVSEVVKMLNGPPTIHDPANVEMRTKYVQAKGLKQGEGLKLYYQFLQSQAQKFKQVKTYHERL